jgi:uncharacterized protein (TIGR03437 family)
MRLHPALFAASLLTGTAAFAQPVINAQGAVNAASYRTTGLPGSGVAKGSMFTLFGTGLGPDPYQQAYSFPLPQVLGGTSVNVTVGDATVPAILLFVSKYQVNAILPSTVPAGTGTVTVTYNDQTSAPAPIQVVDSAFGIFAYNSAGSGQAVATDTNYQLNTIIHTFHPGDPLILWGTGLGAIAASDAEAPPAGDVGSAVTVHVGNAIAPVSYHGRAPCCAGLDQIVFTVPQGVDGCAVPVGVDTGRGVGNLTTIAVSSSGQACSDSILGSDLVNRLASGQKVRFGYVRLDSFITRRIGQLGSDSAVATFSELDPAAAGLAQYGVSGGYCYAIDCSFGCAARGAYYSTTLSDFSPAQLDAGDLSITGDSTVPLDRFNGLYLGALSGANASRFLWSLHSYTVTGSGRDGGVGGFTATDTASKLTIQFSNLTDAQAVSRSSDLVLRWTGGDPSMQNGQVTLGALSANSDFSQFALVHCVAPYAPKQFTIPAWILSTLPPSGSYPFGSPPWPIGWVWIGQTNNPVSFSAPNLDRGILVDTFYNRAEVNFQ